MLCKLKIPSIGALWISSVVVAVVEEPARQAPVSRAAHLATATLDAPRRVGVLLLVPLHDQRVRHLRLLRGLQQLVQPTQ